MYSVYHKERSGDDAGLVTHSANELTKPLTGIQHRHTAVKFLTGRTVRFIRLQGALDVSVS